MTTTIILDDRQLAHVLAALRITQNLDDHRKMVAMEYFTELTGFPLETGEVDALCEAINCSDGPPESDTLTKPDALPALIDMMQAYGALHDYASGLCEDGSASRRQLHHMAGLLLMCNPAYHQAEQVRGPLPAPLRPEETPKALPESPPFEHSTRNRAAFVAFAREKYADPSDDDIEIDDGAALSEDTEEGTWVAAWVWVYDTDVEEGRACRQCATRLDPGEGVDTEDGLLCYDCDQYQGPCSDEEG